MPKSEDNVRVETHIIFEEDTEFGKFKDAIVLEEGEYENLTISERNAKIRERVDKWRLKHLHQNPKRNG